MTEKLICSPGSRLVLTLALLTTFASCGGDGGTETEETPADPELEATITFPEEGDLLMSIDEESGYGSSHWFGTVGADGLTGRAVRSGTRAPCGQEQQEVPDADPAAVGVAASL